MGQILVAGGAGYIGSHTAKALAQAGHTPVVLDNLSAGHRWAVKWGPLVVGEIADSALLRKVIEDYDIEAVIHFAAHAYVGESMIRPGKYFQNNVTDALKFVDAVLASGVRQFVFSSTCATYGIPHTLPINEQHSQLPVNPYGESKLFFERVLSWYGQAYGLRPVCLRYFNASGADPDGEIGEVHDPETHLIPLAIQAAQGSYPALRIFGDDYPTPDGTAVRDYTHVCDLADAHVRALDYLHRGGTPGAFNLGTGRGYSVREVEQSVSSVSGRSVPKAIYPRRAGDPPALVADATEAARVLGWRPRFTDLDSIIDTAWNWHSRFEAEATEQLAPTECAA